MEITDDEFKMKSGYTHSLVRVQNFLDTKIVKTEDKPVDPVVTAVDSIFGILKGKVPDSIDRNSLREERLSC